ncbi:MAG: CoA transferase, partial [Myxococcales bacterium]|nr:CoA transferase [Myxococcales bacterium]
MPALTGLRVLDLSRLLPGPFATMVLADLGATVDKVEDPAGGDYLRLMPPQVDGMCAAFWALNRGKRSLVLDLKSEAGRAAFLDLVPTYDVLVESFRPGVMDKLGLGYGALSARSPGLIFASLSGYGATGPLTKRAGHDLNYLARSGVLGLTGPEATKGPPQLPGVQIADIGGGALFAVVGILAALEERRRTGRGQFLDISLAEGAVSFGLFGLMGALAGLSGARGDDVLTGGIAPYNTYVSKDGVPVTVAALEPKFWMAFCQATGLEPDLEALAPGPHQAKLKQRVAETVAARTADEWRAFGESHDCCVEVVVAPEALPSDPLHAERHAFARTDGAELLQPLTPVSPR